MNSAPIDARSGEDTSGYGSAERPQAKLIVILRKALPAAWDRLGLLLAVSATWALMVSLPLSIEKWLPRNSPIILHLIVIGLVPVAAALPTAGLFSLAHRIAVHEEAFYYHLWRDGAALFGPALRLLLIQCAAAAVLITAIVFYLRTPIWVGRVALPVCGYVLLVWSMALVYQWPALIAQENGLFDEPERIAKRGALAAIRRSLFLALGRPFLTLALLAVLLLMSLLMAVTAVLPALLWSGMTALICTYTARDLLVQYGVLPAPVTEIPIPDEQFRIGDLIGKR